MIILAPTTDSLYLVNTPTTCDLEVHASWMDNNAGTITPEEYDAKKRELMDKL